MPGRPCGQHSGWKQVLGLLPLRGLYKAIHRVQLALPAGSPAGGRRAHASAILFLLRESTAFSRKQRNRCFPRCQRPGVEPSSASGRLRDLARVPSSLSPGLSPAKWEACWLVWKAPLSHINILRERQSTVGSSRFSRGSRLEGAEYLLKAVE